MPVIPIVNEQQQMNVSSPVEIGQADTSGFKAIENLGKASVDLGNELDRVQKALKEQMDKDTVGIAAAEYKAAQMRVIRNEEFYGENKSLTGLEADKAVRGIGDENRDALADKFRLDDKQKLMFKHATLDIDNDFAPNVMVKSYERSTKEYESTRQSMLLSTGKNVVNGVTSFQEAMTEIIKHNTETPGIMNRPEAIRKEQKELVMQVYAQHRFGNEFAKAENFLNMNQEIFTAEEFIKEKNALQSDKSQYINDQISQETLQEKRLTKQVKEVQTMRLSEFMVQKQNANGDYTKLATINEKILQAGMLGSVNPAEGLDPDAAKQLAAWNPQDVEEKYNKHKSEIFQKAFLSGNYRAGIADAHKRRLQRKIDPITEVEITTELGRLVDRDRRARKDNRWDLSRETFKNALTIITGNEALSPDQKTRAVDIIYRDMMKTLDSPGATVPTIDVIIDKASEQLGSALVPADGNVSRAGQSPNRSIEELESELRSDIARVNTLTPGSTEHKRLMGAIKNRGKIIQRRKEDAKTRGENTNGRSRFTRGVRR